MIGGFIAPPRSPSASVGYLIGFALAGAGYVLWDYPWECVVVPAGFVLSLCVVNLVRRCWVNALEGK